MSSKLFKVLLGCAVIYGAYRAGKFDAEQKTLNDPIPEPKPEPKPEPIIEKPRHRVRLIPSVPIQDRMVLHEGVEVKKKDIFISEEEEYILSLIKEVKDKVVKTKKDFYNIDLLQVKLNQIRKKR